MEQSGTPGGTRATATPVTVAVDAMGGDNDPQAAVRGALEAALKDGIRVLLVGDRERLQALSEEWRRALPDNATRAADVLRSHVEIVPAGSRTPIGPRCSEVMTWISSRPKPSRSRPSLTSRATALLYAHQAKR